MNLEFLRSDEDHWMSISDIMTGLMMVFLFISISYMLQANKEKDRVKEIAVTYNKLQNRLYESLQTEFESDLIKWHAEIDKETLSVRFKEPEVLFEVGSDQIKDRFREILDDFFPRYIGILSNDEYKSEIEEIRIEGHTSSEWFNLSDVKEAYFLNMELSQNRTRSVLEYVLNIESVDDHFDWLRSYLTANGLSSGKMIKINGIEDKERSRRVEFRIRTNAEKRIVRIINQESK